MTDRRIEGIRACVFDAYGTLFDFHAAAGRAAGTLGEKAAALSALWRDKQLEYTWLRSLMGRYEDFWQVTAAALDVALDRVGIATPALRAELLDAYRRLDAFPEVRAALARLRAGGLGTAILSNGTATMLRAAVEANEMRGLLDHVLSVDEVGIYKPAPAVYALAVDRLGAPPERILFVSANAWDAHGAKSFGLRVAWCNRTRQPPERLPGAPDATIESLAELPALLGLEDAEP